MPASALASLTLLGVALAWPAPALGQDLTMLPPEVAAEAPPDGVSADRAAQRLEVALVGTLTSGGAAGGRPGTVTIRLPSVNDAAATATLTLDLELPAAADSAQRDGFAQWLRGVNGARGFLAGHLHGAAPRPVLHVLEWGRSPAPDWLLVEHLEGALIDQRDRAFADGEGLGFAVEATHGGAGTPVRFELELEGVPAGVDTITLLHAEAEGRFVTSPRVVLLGGIGVEEPERP